MSPADAIQPAAPTETEERHPTIAMNDELKIVLTRLVFWGRGVGIITTISGVFLALGIVLFMIPAAVAGTVLIIMGLRLLSVSTHFRNLQSDPSSDVLINALRRIRSYIFLNGLLLVIVIVLAAVAFFWIIRFGNVFWEFWDESIYHFVLTRPLSPA